MYKYFFALTEGFWLNQKSIFIFGSMLSDFLCRPSHAQMRARDRRESAQDAPPHKRIAEKQGCGKYPMEDFTPPILAQDAPMHLLTSLR